MSVSTLGWLTNLIAGPLNRGPLSLLRLREKAQ